MTLLCYKCANEVFVLSFLPSYFSSCFSSFFLILPLSPSSSSPLPSSPSLYPSLIQNGSHFSFDLCEIQVCLLCILTKAIPLYREEHGRERVKGCVDKTSHTLLWNLPLTRYQVHIHPSYTFHSVDLPSVHKPCRLLYPMFLCSLACFIICALCVTFRENIAKTSTQELPPIWSFGFSGFKSYIQIFYPHWILYKKAQQNGQVTQNEHSSKNNGQQLHKADVHTDMPTKVTIRNHFHHLKTDFIFKICSK